MQHQIQRIRDLTAEMPLIQSLNRNGHSEIHSQLCHSLSSHSFRKNEVIVNIGEVGVYVRVKRKDKVHQEEQLFLVKILRQGDWFGEVGMVHNQESLVSYVCLEQVETATVELKTFKVMLEQYFLIRMTFQINFLREIPFFWCWSENQLRILYQVYSQKKYCQEDPVYLQGDSSQFIYIIKEGQFRIFKHFDELRIRKYFDKRYKDLLDSDKNNIKTLRIFEEEKNLQVISFKKSQHLTSQLKQKVGRLSKHEMFGEEDILAKSVRKYSVICESDYGEVYLLTKSAMKYLIMSNEKSKNYILARLKNKQSTFSKRLDNISQYVSSAKINVIERNQDQHRMTENYLTSRMSRQSDQQSHVQSMKSLSKFSDVSQSTAKNIVKSQIRLDLPSVSSTHTLFQHPTTYKHNQNSSIQNNPYQMRYNSSMQNLDDFQGIISRTSVNFKSFNNLHLADNPVETQYYVNTQSIPKQIQQTTTTSKQQQLQEKKRLIYMKKYHQQFKFNIVDTNYSQKIINQCTDLKNEYSSNSLYAKGPFNTKCGQRGLRCLGIDQPRDTQSEYEQAKLQIQQELDADQKPNHFYQNQRK